MLSLCIVLHAIPLSNCSHHCVRVGAGVAVLAIVCIGFLVFLVILGVARVRSAQRRSVEVSMDSHQEMEWDNSALNITVNPMDREVSLSLCHRSATAI
jgi:Calsyntenin C-terminal